MGLLVKSSLRVDGLRETRVGLRAILDALLDVRAGRAAVLVVQHHLTAMSRIMGLLVKLWVY